MLPSRGSFWIERRVLAAFACGRLARHRWEHSGWVNWRARRSICDAPRHHLTLTDEAVQYDSKFKMNPPLGAREDREALLAGLADGTVDAIATDHAPHEPALKDVEFDRAPFGILGFETALALALEQLVQSGRISLMRMVEFFASGPARVLGIES